MWRDEPDSASLTNQRCPKTAPGCQYRLVLVEGDENVRLQLGKKRDVKRIAGAGFDLRAQRGAKPVCLAKSGIPICFCLLKERVPLKPLKEFANASYKGWFRAVRSEAKGTQGVDGFELRPNAEEPNVSAVRMEKLARLPMVHVARI